MSTVTDRRVLAVILTPLIEMAKLCVYQAIGMGSAGTALRRAAELRQASRTRAALGPRRRPRRLHLPINSDHLASFLSVLTTFQSDLSEFDGQNR